MSPCFTPEESENVLLSLKQSYGGKFNSLDNSDLLKCFHLLEKHGYVTENNLKLIEDFIALKSKKRVLIEDAIKSFKASHPVTADQEKRLRGRNDEITKINRKLESKDSAALNLYGSSGVGKTKLAKEVCSQWRGIYRVFDLRKVKDMRAIYYSILHILELPVPVGYVELKNVVAKVQEKIEELQSKREGHAVLFMLDNVDRFTAGEGKEGKNLKTAFTQFLEKLLASKDKRSKLKLLLTSRTQLRDSKRVENFEVKPLKRSFSEKILFPAGTLDVQPHQMDKFIQATKGSPLFLEILDPILRQGRKSVDDLIVRLTLTPKKSKVEEDASEKPFDFEEDGVDMVQMFVMRESFDTLPTESLKVSAVVISLFHGPFTVLTAAKVLGIDQSEAIALLEGLVASRIIFVVDEEAKERKYDIHPLLQKYADSITSQENFCVPYLEAKARFYELFMHRMEEIAKYIEPDYVKAFHLFETDRGNYEFTVDISLQPEYFSVPGEFHKNALIASLFEAMLNDKQIEVFHSWAEKCEEDGKTGSLTREQLKCWEAKQVLDVHGTEKALEVLATAFCSLEEVRDKSSNFFKLTKGLYLYSEGEILWRNGAFQKALKSLESSLEFSESLLKEHTTLARCYNAIGNCYSSLEEEVKALEFYNKAYNMQKKLAGSEHHFDIPIYKNQIGAAYVGQGEFKKATKCYKDALSLLKELKLLGSWDEAQFLRNLANAYIHREKYEKAVEPAARAYAIRMKILENHPLTVQSKYQQALIQWYLNEDEKSLQLFLEAWKMEKALDAGNHSPVWQDIIANVETLYDSLRKRNRKKQFRKEALEFCERLWEERKSSALFCFDGFDKEIIDTILQLLGDKKDKYHIYKAEKEQLSERYSAAKEDFQEESDKTQSVPHHLLAASEGDKVPDTKSKDGEDEEEEIEVEISDEEDTTPNPADTKKTVIKRDRITDKGDTWNLPEAGAFITFCPGIMKEPLWICCSLWSPRSLSPPIDSNELLVSNVIELSRDGPPTLESMEDATGSITVGLLHSASDFKGYEVVIKTLVDPESNEWYDLETRIVWDTAEMRPAISKWTCPYAEATSTITRFSSFAVIWRLKSFTFPKPNSMTPEFICSVPDYPNVSIVIPWNSLPESTDFCLTLKIQEPPSTDHKREEVLVGPILHVLCSHEVKLSEPAKINLPLEFFEGKRELVHSGQWRIFHFQQEWADITDQLEMSVSLSDGIVTFKVKAFCRFWPLIATVNAGDISNLDRRSMRQRAGFLACICRDDERFLLKLFCFPLNWKSKVNEYISCYNVIYQGDGNSKKPLFNEDQTFVSLSEGLKVHGEKNIEDLSLTFFGDGEDQENVYVTIRDKSNMSVDFLKWLNAEGKRDPEWICKVPMIRRFSPQDPSSCAQYIPCKTLLRKTEMMKTPVEFFGIPVNDEILSNPRARDVLAIGKQFVGSEVYEDLLHRLEKASLNERQTIQSFFEILAGLNIEFQNGCFDALVKKLSTHGGYQHVADRLKEGKDAVCKSLQTNREVKKIVSEKVEHDWKSLARELGLTDGTIDAISEEEQNKCGECCYKALQ
ncbi:hypothetical protein AWC38_SpisGene19409 [Stylophora pistillata]|uniref:Death domain-containing protein n=2 Tax=Stylophora pistillata TaxID=50429 RepID=A0A2B4RHQ2_STYPI|nr:hypothetical protein AWC38_SpisGene19409 [Stylophora pistillata]